MCMCFSGWPSRFSQMVLSECASIWVNGFKSDYMFSLRRAHMYSKQWQRMSANQLWIFYVIQHQKTVILGTVRNVWPSATQWVKAGSFSVDTKAIVRKGYVRIQHPNALHAVLFLQYTHIRYARNVILSHTVPSHTLTQTSCIERTGSNFSVPGRTAINEMPVEQVTSLETHCFRRENVHSVLRVSRTLTMYSVTARTLVDREFLPCNGPHSPVFSRLSLYDNTLE